MISFTTALVCLMLGYLIYGQIVDRTFGPDKNKKMPCYEKQDGVDFMPMQPVKVFLVQFLNIAGTGPIFGAIMGILFGPAAYLWIVLGCIFAGSVHDYMCGMICIRKGGVSLPEIVGDELGVSMRQLMRVLSIVLLVLVGTVFVTTPAALLDTMLPLGNKYYWIAIIFVYYILATLLPIDKLIGRIYPIFGLALLIMAAGLLYHIFFSEGYVPELTDSTFTSHHPQGLSIFPMLCITIACGAISGFHGTQSPLMARCLTNEKYGRPIFYGSMITEGVVALIWAAAAVKFADTLPGEGTAYEKLAAMGNPSVVVNEVCSSWMGTIGACLAVLGVVAAPITSGDTAFRSARLIVADFMNMSQKTFVRRLLLCLPLFLVSVGLLFLDFNILWRYFAWTNQTLASITLWAATVWLCKNGKKYMITLVPAVFMTCVCTSYILVAKEGFQIDLNIGLTIGIIAAIASFAAFIVWKRK
ncbi:MAG: carbon starvation protein A [Bacteroidales bacterium]|nr:carbon starvation protein A [Candidatus Liminaster caballi]